MKLGGPKAGAVGSVIDTTKLWVAPVLFVIEKLFTICGSGSVNRSQFERVQPPFSKTSPTQLISPSEPGVPHPRPSVVGSSERVDPGSSAKPMSKVKALAEPATPSAVDPVNVRKQAARTQRRNSIVRILPGAGSIS